MIEKEEKAIKNIKEIIDLSKEEIENNDENTTAILDITDLKSLAIVLKSLEQKDKEIQELKADLYECNNIISDYIDTVKEKDKMIDLFKRRIVITENEHKEILKIQEKFLKKDFQDCLIIYFQKKASEENENV